MWQCHFDVQSKSIRGSLLFVISVIPLYIHRPTGVNTLWPSDAIWWHRSGSTLAQVMAWCLKAPSHYLNQCWLKHQRGPVAFSWEWFHKKCQRYLSLIPVWKLLIKTSSTSSRGQWVNVYLFPAALTAVQGGLPQRCCLPRWVRRAACRFCSHWRPLPKWPCPWGRPWKECRSWWGCSTWPSLEAAPSSGCQTPRCPGKVKR